MEKKRPGRPKTTKSLSDTQATVKEVELQAMVEESVEYYNKNERTQEIVSSYRDLEYQVALAKSQGIKELDTTPELMSQLLKGEYGDSNKSMMYKDVRLFEVGTKDVTLAKESRSVTEVLHGRSRLKL